MKKLVVAAAVMLLGVVANAASVNWTIKSDWVSADGENPLEVSVYAFDAIASSYDSISAALAKNDTSVLSGALVSGTVNDEGWFYFEGSGISDDGGTPYAVAKVYSILVAEKDGSSYFYASDIKTQEMTDAVMASGALFAWDEINTGAVGGAGWTSMSVPEPTSGLLLLLGMAGLALRRKRA